MAELNFGTPSPGVRNWIDYTTNRVMFIFSERKKWALLWLHLHLSAAFLQTKKSVLKGCFAWQLTRDNDFTLGLCSVTLFQVSEIWSGVYRFLKQVSSHEPCDWFQIITRRLKVCVRILFSSRKYLCTFLKEHSTKESQELPGPHPDKSQKITSPALDNLRKLVISESKFHNCH